MTMVNSSNRGCDAIPEDAPNRAFCSSETLKAHMVAKLFEAGEAHRALPEM